jgi:ubiquinone/menaquinone biosynthesis C-methylase UbiE
LTLLQQHIPQHNSCLYVDDLPLWESELDLMEQIVELNGVKLIEIGCGAARLARDCLLLHPTTSVTALEVDAIQMQKNMTQPPLPNLHFVSASGHAIPAALDSFDGAFMLKSLHHVPEPWLGTALAEISRVLKPGGWFYVSEPIYAGSLNDIVKLFNDEGAVRAAAQEALNLAIQNKVFEAVSEHRFAQSVHYGSFEQFAKRMLYPSFIDLQITPDLISKVEQAYAPHQQADGAHFVRPMHVRLLRKP